MMMGLPSQQRSLCTISSALWIQYTGAYLEGGVGGPNQRGWRRKSPVGSRGEAPAGGWGRSPPEAGALKNTQPEF